LAETPVQPAIFIIRMEFRRDEKGRQWWSVCEIGAMKGAGGASCQGWQLCAAWNKCFTAAAPRDLIKKVVQKCGCPFVLFQPPFFALVFV
jgi:hypothetical protein